MPKQVKLRRGTTAQHATFTGAQGEVTMDTTKKTLVVHDGATAGGIPLAPESTVTAIETKTGNMVWVDAVNGSDLTGMRGRLQRPFLTLTAAKTAAQAGDTIVVLPGIYNERNLLKNGVNWHFLSGAKVVYTGAAEGGIWDDSYMGTGGAVICKITGQGEFENRGSNASSWVFYAWYAGTDIHLEALSMMSEQRSALRLGGGRTRLYAKSIRSNSWRAVELEAGDNFIRAEEIISAGEMAVLASIGKHSIYADTISCSGGPALWCTAGEIQVTARLVQSSASYGLQIVVDEDPVFVTMNGARIVSTLQTVNGKAVQMNGGSDLTLKDCVLVANMTGTPAAASIDSSVAASVRIYGSCMANLAKGANVTFITGATRFEVDSDVR
jgi:hypothetical protein